MVQKHITIRNARSHNLRGVDCRIPLRALTVITGVSGSGKSSLAFDTLYAEGQRRYVTSLSTYARQFLERLPRPEVDSISHLPPAIAIEQRNRVTQARSTVGTATEILDSLRLLFSRTGEPHCPDCQRPALPGSVSAVSERISKRWSGRRIVLAAPFAWREGEAAEAFVQRLLADGYTRIVDRENEIVDWVDVSGDRIEELLRGGLRLIDRLALSKKEASTRLREAVETAFDTDPGEIVVIDESGERASLWNTLACDGCGRRFQNPEPALFSFNSPMGACPECQGFGRVPALDRERVVPDAGKSLREGAIAPFNTPMGKQLQYELLRACDRRDISVEVPFGELTEGEQDVVFDGEGEDWYGVRGFFGWLEKRRYKVQARVLVARYRRYDRCPECEGGRLCADALCVRVGGRTLPELSRQSLSELRAWADSHEPIAEKLEVAEPVLQRLRSRLGTVEAVGLGYLGLDRSLRTLSGGEAQRIQLATALSGSLTAVLYVLDEPSVGLHPRDIDRLLDVLESIRAQGNTVVVVEHAPEIVAAAQHVIDLGPAAGTGGGRIVAQGRVEEIRAHESSETGRALRGEFEPLPSSKRHPSGEIRVVGACENNLKGIDVSIPLGCLTAVTGVSGAGKSTLVNTVLVRNLRGEPDRGACERIEGAVAVGDVVVVDQSPASRSPRSNPATVSKAFDSIRRRFAATREARALGFAPGWFSFNVRGGRCDACEGSGEVVIDMQFLDDLRVPCDECNGSRYRREVLGVRLNGRSIVDVLGFSIDEALEFFASDRSITSRLQPLSRVGLGYLTLGQPLSTLSGGEHQRVRLATVLAEGVRDRLYVLDEPTTGLHPADIQVLLRCLDALLDEGGTVLVVEHNLDVIAHADFILDLGPEGGPGGGEVVAAGSPEEVAQVSSSHTGRALRARSDTRAGG